MSEAEVFFTELIEQIPNAKIGKMFGALCAKMPNGKSGAMFWRDNIVVRLKEEDSREALNLPGSGVFEPMEGRPMNGWYRIPYEYKNQWLHFALISAKTAEELEEKKSKKKK